MHEQNSVEMNRILSGTFQSPIKLIIRVMIFLKNICCMRGMCPVAKRMLICMAQKRKEDAVINKIPFFLLERSLKPATILELCYIATTTTAIHMDPPAMHIT